jgi:putative ABC transport system permease protein
LGKSFLQIAMTDPGFEARNLITARVEAPPASLRPMMEQLRALPGVESVALTNAVPGATDIGGVDFFIDSRPSERQHTQTFGVTPEYFETLGIPLRRGRVFTDRDTPESGEVIVVNEAFVRRFFPNENPIGHRVRGASPFFCGSAECPWEEIIGVVGDVRGHQLDLEPQLMAYESIWQSKTPRARGPILRVASNPTALIPIIQKTIAALVRTQPVYDVKLVEERFSDSLAGRRFNAILIASFALVAVFLAAIGLYGVMSYLVTLRSQEMGIRLTLGAQPPQIVGMILKEGVVLGVVGAALGIVGALGLSRFLTSLLYHVSTLDLSTYVAVTALLLGMVLAACYFPGRRAAHSDPLTVLRHE